MRPVFSILFFVIIFTSTAEQFTVFEKDGYYGIKDESGNVSVPAVYERLGWSDGTSKVINGVVGFRQNKLWGLISVKNKPLTGHQFYAINPIQSGYFKASIKGKFSNQLFHGILDDKGNTIISFHYFTIEALGSNWLMSTFEAGTQKFGVVSYNNTILIPANYSKVEEVENTLKATTPNNKIDLYTKKGIAIKSGLDSAFYSKGWVAFQDGYAGMITTNGKVKIPFSFKGIKQEDSKATGIPFPEWSVYRNDSLWFKQACDSISLKKNGLFIAYLNGAQHFLLGNETVLDNRQLMLKDISAGQMIVQNSKTRKWAVFSKGGNEIFGAYDSLARQGRYYLGLQKTKGWFILNRAGKPQNKLPFKHFRSGLSGQILVKKNNLWGIVAPGLATSISYKYDSVAVSGDRYFVSYLNSWGVMNTKKEWILRPSFDKVTSYGNLTVGQKGRAFAVYYQNELKIKTTSMPTQMLGDYVLMKSEDRLFGLLDPYGNVKFEASYTDIAMRDDYFLVNDTKGLALQSKTGKIIFDVTDFYQDVLGLGENYFVVKKEGRWGYVDLKGRLRISNRYDSAMRFSEGMAAVMLKGKWGYIDKSESLKVQPYYDEVAPFNQGMAVVKQIEKYGLIDKEGREVLGVKWKFIERLPTGNYILINFENQCGLANAKGNILLRPAFDQLEDLGNRVIVSSKERRSLIDYSGRQVFRINYKDIKVIEGLTMVKN